MSRFYRCFSVISSISSGFSLAAALVFFSLGFLLPSAKANPVPKDCAYKGIHLYGKIQVVKSFPDIKVQVVESFPDLKVKWVDSFPDKCGLWQRTESFPDIKIQFVKSFPDIKIEFVDSFPGLP